VVWTLEEGSRWEEAVRRWLVVGREEPLVGRDPVDPVLRYALERGIKSLCEEEGWTGEGMGVEVSPLDITD
jgi:hypothetical protein